MDPEQVLLYGLVGPQRGAAVALECSHRRLQVSSSEELRVQILLLY
jgi:hypothetical protein